MTYTADKLLRGAYDMHAHGHPQFSLNSPPRLDDYDWAIAAKSAGMGGFVIKSHMWPTMASAYLVNKLIPEVKVFGSVTLNDISGGINPAYAQIAAESGAKIIFMPTWSGVNDVSQGCHYFERMRPYVTRIDCALKNGSHSDGIPTLDSNGNVLPEVLDVLDVCKEYDIVCASGHISIDESIKIAEQAALKGAKFVLTHPLLSPLISASHEQMKAIADTGGYVEHVFIGCMPMHGQMNPRLIYDAIEAVGPKHTVMSSDAIEGWNPPEPEVLRMFISSMLRLGISEDDIYTMTHTNPAHLLNAPLYPMGEGPGSDSIEASAIS